LRKALKRGRCGNKILQDHFRTFPIAPTVLRAISHQPPVVNSIWKAESFTANVPRVTVVFGSKRGPGSISNVVSVSKSKTAARLHNKV
jgi:hypothetical protein